MTSKIGTTSTIELDSTAGHVIFDTGTSVCYLSMQNAEKLNVGKLGISLYREISTASNKIYYVSCDIIDDLPYVTFKFDGQTITIGYVLWVILS